LCGAFVWACRALNRQKRRFLTRADPGRLPGTGDYAAKQWQGLLGGYYRARWALYGRMAADAIAAAGGRRHAFPNATAWALAEDNLTDSWARAPTSYPCSPRGDAVAIGRAAYAKYSALLLAPPPPVLPSGSTPAGYEAHVGGYWKSGMAHSAGRTIAACAAACTAAKAGCVAFELSATRVCYMFSSTSGYFIKNPGCRTFTKIHAREK
jgi:hypothetical protein